jgi:hypothetical protein
MLTFLKVYVLILIGGVSIIAIVYSTFAWGLEIDRDL